MRPIPLTPATAALRSSAWPFAPQTRLPAPPPQRPPHVIPVTPSLPAFLVPHRPTSPSYALSSATSLIAPPGPSRLLSHHGFTPPVVSHALAPPPPLAVTATVTSPANKSPPSASSILLTPEVELTRVAPPNVTLNAGPDLTVAFRQATPVTILLSEPRPLPPTFLPGPPAGLPSGIAATVDPSSMSEEGRARRPKPDDLVPPGCGLSREEIVNAPIDDFNEKVSEKTEEEILVLKDRRRRGKNRVNTLRSILTFQTNKPWKSVQV